MIPFCRRGKGELSDLPIATFLLPKQDVLGETTNSCYLSKSLDLGALRGIVNLSQIWLIERVERTGFCRKKRDVVA